MIKLPGHTCIQTRASLFLNFCIDHRRYEKITPIPLFDHLALEAWALKTVHTHIEHALAYHIKSETKTPCAGDEFKLLNNQPFPWGTNVRAQGFF